MLPGRLHGLPLRARTILFFLTGSLVPLMLAEGIAFVALRSRSLYPAQIANRRNSPSPLDESGRVTAASLPPGEVLVRVRYSDVNYKDGLAVTGRPGVIRKYPMMRLSRR